MKTNILHMSAAVLLGLMVQGASAAQSSKSTQTHSRDTIDTQQPEAGQPNTRGKFQNPDRERINGQITRIDRSRGTITVEDPQTGRQVLHITTDTRLRRGGQSLNMQQLREGEQIRAQTTRAGEMQHATSVDVQQ